MRTPGLRLRQVFEHTNHFKVQKPTGETITIAKKGLSPSTVGRLRRFAQGGEVRNYQVGGEVADEAELTPEEAKQQAEAEAFVQRSMPQWSEAPATSVEQEIPRTGRRVVTAAENEAALAELAAQRAAPTRPVAPPPAPVAAPAPVSVVVNTAPAPVAPQAPVSAPIVAGESQANLTSPSPLKTAPKQYSFKPVTFRAKKPSTASAPSAPAMGWNGLNSAELHALRNQPDSFIEHYVEFRKSGLSEFEAALKANELEPVPTETEPQKPLDEEEARLLRYQPDSVIDKFVEHRRAGLSVRDAALRANEQRRLSSEELHFLRNQPDSFISNYIKYRGEGLSVYDAALKANAQEPSPAVAQQEPKAISAPIATPTPATKELPAPAVASAVAAPAPTAAPTPAAAPEPVAAAAPPTAAAPAPVISPAPVPAATAPVAPVAAVPAAAPTPVPVAPATQPVAAPAPAAPPPVVAAPAPVPAAPAAPVAPTAPVAPPADGGVMTDEQIEEYVRVLPLAYQPTARMGLATIRDEHIAQQKQNEAALKLVEQQVKEAKEIEQRSLEKINKARELRDDVSDRIKLAMSRGNFFSEMNIWGKLGTLAAMALSGYATGYAGIPNYALDAFNKALERDIERQRRDVDSLVSQFKAITGSEEAGVELYKSVAKEAMALQLKQAEMQSSNVKTRAAAAAASAKFMNDSLTSATSAELRLAQADLANARVLSELSKPEKEAEAEEFRRKQLEETRRHNRAMETKKTPTSTVGRERLEFAKEKYESAITVPVEDEKYLLASDQGNKEFREQLARRTSGVRAAQKVTKLLKDASIAKVANPFSGTRGEALAELNLLSERFSEGFGYKRAISLAASKVVKAALDNPTGAEALFKQFASDNGRPIWVGVNAMAEDMAKARTQYMKTNSRADERGQEALKRSLSALEQADEKELKSMNFGFEPVRPN